MCRIFSPASGFFFLPPAGNFLPIAAESCHRRRQKKNELPYICPQDKPPPPPHIKFLQILHISPALSKFLDRKCWRPDAKSNIFDKMQLIAFTVPKNPRKIAVSQTGTSLAITMGRRSTDRRIYVSLFE
jgi:hypothetical protein